MVRNICLCRALCVVESSPRGDRNSAAFLSDEIFLAAEEPDRHGVGRSRSERGNGMAGG